jgi:hypothetical protein
MAILTLSGNREPRMLVRTVDKGRNRERAFTIVVERWLMKNGNIIPKPITELPLVDGQGLTGANVTFEDGVATYEWKFQTVDTNPSSWSGFPNNTGGGKIVMFDGSLNKTPITMHRDFGQWIGYVSPEGKKYGTVVEGEVQWELQDPNAGAGSGSGRRGLDKDNKEVTNMNPFYGIKDFYDVSALHIEEKEYTKGQLGGVLAKIGEIDRPPSLKSDENADGAQDRNWLYVGADATQVGNKFWVKRTWMLSGFGQWEPALYDPTYYGGAST